MTLSRRASSSACVSTPLDVELDLAESHRGTSVELDEVSCLGEHREVDCQVVQLELDLVDLDTGAST